ncbi:hypothetical protein [Archaeoglobus neptunius]|uniref:hypothetical protein n=1 Tax=Archaeoglobus neptunius TaxID=2798580 RepID=UPI00192910CF|nr:hypothetical protein [Archaeoglobus neptunius]
MPTQSALEALAILRDPSTFQWYVITLLLVVIYMYASELSAGNYRTVFAALAFWGMDWFNEIWNALVFHFTNYAALWMAPGKTAYLILIGLNVEISMMFAIMGIASTKLLPEDRGAKVFGIPNRIFYAIMLSAACVFVEVLLNAASVLVWEYWWWSARMPVLIFFIGYLPFFLVAYRVYDMKSVRKQALTAFGILGFDFALFAISGGVLGWI